jgi:hypothetical protein
MLKASVASVFVVLLGLLAPAAHAQRGRDVVPAGYRPPPGMCRIWVDGVPAGQQPAPIDCATALRTRPSNGRVIFGDEGESRPKKSGGFLPRDWQPRREEPRTEPKPDERRTEPKREERREEPKREPRRRVEPRRPERDPR